MKRIIGGLAALAVVVVVSGCTDPFEGKSGEDLYRQACAQCHSGDLSGGTGPAIGTGTNADVELSDAQIFGVIEVGPGSMPGFEDRLTSEQIQSLVDYLRSVQRGG